MNNKSLMKFTAFAVTLCVVTGILCFGIVSCIDNQKRKSTETSKVLTTPTGDVLNYKIPEDGRAHVIYKNEYYVIKAKVIFIEGSYTSHVVWTESLTSPNQITNLSTH